MSSSVALPRSLPATSLPSPKRPKRRSPPSRLPLRRPTQPLASLHVGVQDIAQIVHNKALVAAAVASVVGQLSKPLTSALSGKGIDLKAVVRSGGMPSTHAASVVAAVTSVGLERGFADSIFGMSVVFAGIVMYDAQGVRREVGYHAKFLNKIQEKLIHYLEDGDVIVSKPETSSTNSENLVPLLSIYEKANSYKSDPDSNLICRSGITSSGLQTMSPLKIDDENLPDPTHSNYSPFNESVGHTRIQVLVGALLGFVMSLAIETIL